LEPAVTIGHGVRRVSGKTVLAGQFAEIVDAPENRLRCTRKVERLIEVAGGRGERSELAGVLRRRCRCACIGAAAAGFCRGHGRHADGEENEKGGRSCELALGTAMM